MWHRNNPPWEGTRVSFVAFTSDGWLTVGPDRRDEVRKDLRHLGFRPPTEAFLEAWKTDVRANVGSAHPPEPVRKGAHTSYKARGKKQKQEELFPDLLKELEKKRAERYRGAQFSAEERFGAAFKQEIAKLSMDRIGGAEEEKKTR